MSKVVSIDGQPLPEEDFAGGDVNPDIVAALERLLERARSGDMRGMVCVYLHSDWATGAVIAGTRSFSVLGRMEDVKLSMLEDLK